MVVQGAAGNSECRMNVAFRVDASIQIGTGHVMRCLTLAEELRAQGHECLFVCRNQPGHLGNYIVGKGFTLYLLSSEGTDDPQPSVLNWNSHATWLEVSWQLDVQQTRKILSQHSIDWLVVDHYALDSRWEQELAVCARQIMVIDDLADRQHQCCLLLDQTFGRSEAEYRALVPGYCQLLCGSNYALLRPEFAELRSYSLQRRTNPGLHQLLITMGGVDKDNVTGLVLDALCDSDLADDCKIIVVMGATAPWLDQVRKKVETLPWPIEVKVGVNNMAQLMADSDLAIGAAGATSWERCCLGLPSVMVVLADNQRTIAHNLYAAGAAEFIQFTNGKLELKNLMAKIDLKTLSEKSKMVCDGQGVLETTRWMCGQQ